MELKKNKIIKNKKTLADGMRLNYAEGAIITELSTAWKFLGLIGEEISAFLFFFVNILLKRSEKYYGNLNNFETWGINWKEIVVFINCTYEPTNTQ